MRRQSSVSRSHRTMYQTFLTWGQWPCLRLARKEGIQLLPSLSTHNNLTWTTWTLTLMNFWRYRTQPQLGCWFPMLALPYPEYALCVHWMCLLEWHCIATSKHNIWMTVHTCVMIAVILTITWKSSALTDQTCIMVNLWIVPNMSIQPYQRLRCISMFRDTCRACCVESVADHFPPWSNCHVMNIFTTPGILLIANIVVLSIWPLLPCIFMWLVSMV